MFSSFADNLELNEQLGYSMIAITGINFVVNMGFVIKQLIISVITVLQRLISSKFMQAILKRLKNDLKVRKYIKPVSSADKTRNTDATTSNRLNFSVDNTQDYFGHSFHYIMGNE